MLHPWIPPSTSGINPSTSTPRSFTSSSSPPTFIRPILQRFQIGFQRLSNSLSAAYLYSITLLTTLGTNLYDACSQFARGLSTRLYHRRPFGTIITSIVTLPASWGKGLNESWIGASVKRTLSSWWRSCHGLTTSFFQRVLRWRWWSTRSRCAAAAANIATLPVHSTPSSCLSLPHQSPSQTPLEASWLSCSGFAGIMNSGPTFLRKMISLTQFKKKRASSCSAGSDGAQTDGSCSDSFTDVSSFRNSSSTDYSSATSCEDDSSYTSSRYRKFSIQAEYTSKAYTRKSSFASSQGDDDYTLPEVPAAPPRSPLSFQNPFNRQSRAATRDHQPSPLVPSTAATTIVSPTPKHTGSPKPLFSNFPLPRTPPPRTPPPSPRKRAFHDSTTTNSNAPSLTSTTHLKYDPDRDLPSPPTTPKRKTSSLPACVTTPERYSPRRYKPRRCYTQPEYPRHNMCVDSSSSSPSAPASDSGSDAGDEESPVTFTPLPIPPWHRLKRAEVVFERGDLPESESSPV